MPGDDCCASGFSKESVMITDNRSWAEFYDQGVQYMHTAERSVIHPEKFTPLIIYNLAAIAIEKLIMGVCLRHGTLPFCHTLAGMADFVQSVITMDEKLFNDMKLMDTMQQICSEDQLFCDDPAREDVPFFIDVMKRIFIQTELYLNSGK